MQRKKSRLDDDPLWYKDAVIYELHIKAFKDSNDDGIGDIRGIIQKLDYLQNLGVTAIWLLPFYPSPLRDDGYDIADYTSIHPSYGSLADFRELLNEAHARGIRIITELVLNHTSDQHPWFQKSRRAKPGTKWREFYVWNNSPRKYKDARIIFQDFESSNWSWDPLAKAYYWHRFYSHQPDLNYENPQVHRAMLNIIDFWMDLGVDGVRLDAVPYLYEKENTNCENLPETHAFLKKLRTHVDRKYKNRMLLAEANQWSEDAVAYFGDGDECHMAFNFPVMPRMFMSLQMEDRFPIVEILDPPLEIPDSAQWALFLRNHDELTLEMVTDEERDYMYRMYADDPRAKINVGIRRRLAPLLANHRRRIELMNILLFSLPGTPVLYYGDEIGMGDNYYLGDRDGVRTPMQWSPDRNAGFSRTNPQRLYLPIIIDSEYHYEAVNVETQDKNLSSQLWWMRRIISIRKKYKALSRGTCRFLSPQNYRVLAFVREYEDEKILIVVNLSRFAQCVELDLSEYKDMVPQEAFSHNDFPRITDEHYMITLGPHDHYWFILQQAEEEIEYERERTLPEMKLNEIPGKELDPAVMAKLEQRILARYLRHCRWFGGKSRRIRAIEIIETIPIFRNGSSIFLLLLEVNYNEGQPEIYQLPLAFALGEKAYQISQKSPQAIIADIIIDEDEGILFDGVYDEEFHNSIFEMIAKRKKQKAKRGEFVTSRGRKFKADLEESELPLNSAVLGAEQSNTSILYGEQLIFKLYRRLEDGINPDAEIGRLLSERKKFPHIPAYKGSIEYRRQGKKDPIFIGLMQDYILNQGDAWEYMLGHVSIFLETLLARRRELSAPPEVFPLRLETDSSDQYEHVRRLIDDFHTEKLMLLGQRTAEMHRALGSFKNLTEFKPEAFSLHYQRSVFQSMRNLVRKTFRTLDKNYNRIDKENKELAEQILDSQNVIMRRLQRILQKKIPAMKIRIHGDYHLGQVLFTGKDFVIIDFEGEPARPLGERRLKRSPLRDVAGMVRSLHYAINTGLKRETAVRAEDIPFVQPWVRAWYHFASTVYLESYMDNMHNSGLLPKNRADANILFETFLLDKAVYELGYEINNRPDWVDIPMKGLLYLLEGE